MRRVINYDNLAEEKLIEVDLTVASVDDETAESITQKSTSKKKNKKLNIIYDIVIVLGLGAIGFAGYRYFSMQKDYAASNELYEDLNQSYVTEYNPGTVSGADGEGSIIQSDITDSVWDDDTIVLVARDYNIFDDIVVDESSDNQTGSTELLSGSTESLVPWYKLISVDIKKLQREVNGDIRGWIYFEAANQNISYPIAYSTEKAYYLNRSLNGAESIAGTIYIDNTNNSDFKDSRTVVYGHNMRDLSMFGNLKYYRTAGYYDDHQYFQIVTPEGINRYHIFAYHQIADDDVDSVITYQEGNEVFTNWLSDMRSKSNLRTSIRVGANDKVVTLVTCSGNHDHRFLVEGVLEETYKP